MQDISSLERKLAKMASSLQASGGATAALCSVGHAIMVTITALCTLMFMRYFRECPADADAQFHGHAGVVAAQQRRHVSAAAAAAAVCGHAPGSTLQH
jgi:hypothetical protein